MVHANACLTARGRTRIVSFDLVDAALENTRSTQQRVRVLPSRVAVYLLLAAALFTEIGYRQVWARLVAGLDPATVACPGSSALSQAIRRVGVEGDPIGGPVAMRLGVDGSWSTVERTRLG